MEYFSKFVFWHWWIMGILLLGIEIVAPVEFFLWLGISAGVTGGIVLIAPDIGWQWQLVLFGMLSVASVGGWRLYQK
ncbi:MAG: NfeD family protein, partial [Alphaproteobacteria bacterium]|nr:NfeD family protein [Alphaproteobacteria bacterium]